jgi:ABC-type transporter Mla subunit MlaD
MKRSTSCAKRRRCRTSASSQQVQSDPKLTDRPKQIHDLLEDFNYLTDQLDDNFDMFSRQKADFRKSLKKAIEAYSDWQLKLRTLKETSKPEELKQFSFSLETAVENVNAGADTTREMLAEQEAAHKKKGKDDKDDKDEEKKPANR